MQNPQFNPSRRQFLHVSALAGAGFILVQGCGRNGNAANKPASNNAVASTDGTDEPPQGMVRGNLGTVIGPGKGVDRDTGETIYFVGLLDLDDPSTQVKVIDDIDFFGHGVTPNPIKPHTGVIFEKHGKGCCEVDLKAEQILRKIDTVADREFYGHGAFSPDGKTLYATEAITGDNSYDGVVAIRDGESFQLQGNFPTFGVAPHDCILVDDGRTLVITNGGGPIGADDELPSVTYVDVATQTLKQELRFPTREINAGHIAITSKGELVIVSAPRDGLDAMKPGAISFYSPGGKLRTVVDHPVREKMLSETLSVAIHEPSMVVGATNPKGHLITFWDFETGKLLKEIHDYKDPRGISCTLDNRYFAITYDNATHLILLDAKTFEPVEESFVDMSYMSGSHNITYDLPA